MPDREPPQCALVGLGASVLARHRLGKADFNHESGVGVPSCG